MWVFETSFTFGVYRSGSQLGRVAFLLPMLPVRPWVREQPSCPDIAGWAIHWVRPMCQCVRYELAFDCRGKFTQQIWINECLLAFYLSAPFNNILVETFWASMTLAPPQKFRLPDNNPIPGLWIWVFAWCSFLSRAGSWLEMRVIWTGSFFSNPWWSRWCGWGMLKLWKRRVQMHICNHWVYRGGHTNLRKKIYFFLLQSGRLLSTSRLVKSPFFTT